MLFCKHISTWIICTLNVIFCFFHVSRLFDAVTPSAENKSSQPVSAPSDQLQILFTAELLQQVHLNTRFAICIKGNIAQGDLHLWNRKVVMFQHLLFDDTEHWRLDDPAIFIEQQPQRAKPRELRQMLMKHWSWDFNYLKVSTFEVY